MPLWPAYIHLKLGPAPIITPPRIFLYAVTALWLYDMTFSPLRRGQFLLAIRNSRLVGGFVMLLFGLNFMSVPLAQGKLLAGQEFFRQVVIWFLPFCAFATYVRRRQDFYRLLAAAVVGAGGAGVIAMGELASGRLVANLLSPFISGEAEWLRITQEQKIRDGVFRAQATHTHPLSLGEFLALLAPVALGFCAAARSRGRIFWAVILVAILGGVVATNSRGALLGLLMGLGLVGGFMLLRFMKTAAAELYRPAIGLATFAAIAASPVLVVGAHQMISGDSGASAARSTQSRIEQIEKAWPKILKRPVLGYGTGRSARIIGFYGRSLTVDNYYLSLTVDLGFPGPIVFLCMLIFCARGSIRNAAQVARGRSADEAASREFWIWIGFAGAMAAFATSRSIISQTGNLSFFYLVLGAYVGTAARFHIARRPADDDDGYACQPDA